MGNLGVRAFTTPFDSHVMDICENMKGLANGEFSFIGGEGGGDQHEAIFDKYNDFINCLQNPGLVEDRAKKFEKLMSYISLHFVFEEKVMKIIRYPAYEQHRGQHLGFVKRINTLVVEISAGRATLEEMALFMGHWILGHVLISDKAFGEFEELLADGTSH